MDKEILELLKGMAENINSLTMEVKELKEGQEKTNTRLDKIEESQKELKAGQEELKEELKETNTRLDTLEKVQKEITSRLDDISKGIGKLVSDEIGESISVIKKDLKEINKKVDGIEGVTMKNCYDIAKIQVVK